MTARQVWEGLLTELSKVNAPSMLLQDFNYFINKAINQYINKRYNIYDISQQTTDDLRVLKATSILDVTKVTDTNPLKSLSSLGLFGATYEVDLPQDYLHILNCICIYKVNKDYKCYNKEDYVQFAAKRLTADSWSVIINDYYQRPLPERPYFYIHNINLQNTVPTNPYDQDSSPKGTDMKIGGYSVSVVQDEGKSIQEIAGEGISNSSSLVFKTTGTQGTSNLPRTITLNDSSTTIDAVNKETAYRYGNPSNVRMEIRYGYDDSVFTLVKVFIDYIKTPQTIRLTQEQVNLTEDTSQIMEFPDYVCQEIINELTMLVLENTASPRLQTNTIVTKSIANPAQQQTQNQNS